MGLLEREIRTKIEIKIETETMSGTKALHRNPLKRKVTVRAQ